MQRPTACRATKQNGDPCGSVVVLASGYCFLHDPARTADARAFSAKGGRGKARIARVEKLVPDTLRPVLVALLEVLDETRRGDLDPRVANAVASVAGAIVKVYSSATVEQQIGDLQDQVDRLRSRGA